MKKKYSVHRRETHYAMYDVFYDVEAETPDEAVTIAEKYYEAAEAAIKNSAQYSAPVSYLSDYSTVEEELCRTTYVEGETLTVVSKTDDKRWEEGKWLNRVTTGGTANPTKSYVLVLTVGGQFLGLVHNFTSREDAEKNAPILIANAKKQGYTNQFGDYYLDDEDYSYYIREVEIDAPVIPEEADEEEEDL